MPKKIRVKPSKQSSVLGIIGGVIFVFIGLFKVIPVFGVFGVFWTLIAVAIAGYHFYNYFSEKGAASWEVDIDDNAGTEAGSRTSSESYDFETRLRKLHRLKEDGLISEEEYRRKREEILREKW